MTFRRLRLHNLIQPGLTAYCRLSQILTQTSRNQVLQKRRQSQTPPAPLHHKTQASPPYSGNSIQASRRPKTSGQSKEGKIPPAETPIQKIGRTARTAKKKPAASAPLGSICLEKTKIGRNDTDGSPCSDVIEIISDVLEGRFESGLGGSETSHSIRTAWTTLLGSPSSIPDTQDAFRDLQQNLLNRTQGGADRGSSCEAGATLLRGNSCHSITKEIRGDVMERSVQRSVKMFDGVCAPDGQPCTYLVWQCVASPMHRKLNETKALSEKV